MSGAYKAAGVDVEAGYRAVDLMKKHVASTHTKGVLSNIGGFGGMFELNKNEYSEPVLVSGTDGVGTKLKVAFLLNKHDSVGIDCVAMCVNDIVCSGARPLFFLDYLAVGKNVPTRVAEVVKGVAEGCRQAGCALIGGETAEMPGFYPNDEYDLAGFAVGIADKKSIIDGSRVAPGDKLVGIASNGLHSNGFSLVRKVFGIGADNQKLFIKIDSLDSKLGEELIKPTRIYVKPILSLLEKYGIKAISNITGGGFIENIPRMLREGLCAEVDSKSFRIHPIFNLIAQTGSLSTQDMFNTFNMGIGMVLAVSPHEADGVVEALGKMGETAYVIGEVREGAERIHIC